MRIGVDIDEVLYPFLRRFLIFYHARTGKEFEMEDFSSYKIWETLGNTKENTLQMFNELFNLDFFYTAHPIDGAQKAINLLSENNTLVAITARPQTIFNETSNWVRKYFGNSIKEIICTNEFHFSSAKKKADFCVEEGIEVLLEDNPLYAFECAERGIKIILFDKPWNHISIHSYLLHRNITRVRSWNDVLIFLKESHIQNPQV